MTEIVNIVQSLDQCIKIESCCQVSEKKSSKKKKKNRCQFEGCNKKLTITSFECSCAKRFCPIHRLPESHNCTFDYVKAGQEKIRENNPVIINDKINKI